MLPLSKHSHIYQFFRRFGDPKRQHGCRTPQPLRGGDFYRA